MDSTSKVKYKPIEAAKCFSLSNLIQKVKAELISKYPETSCAVISELIGKSLKTFRLNGQTFEFIGRDNYLGGFRWYLKCPKCGETRLKLYLPENLEGREPIYACKDCHMLKNTSAIMGATTKYVKVVRPLKKLEYLKKQLLKKSMSPAKAKALIDEYEAIEKSLESSPEYRLWKFQQRATEADSAS